MIGLMEVQGFRYLVEATEAGQPLRAVQVDNREIPDDKAGMLALLDEGGDTAIRMGVYLSKRFSQTPSPQAGWCRYCGGPVADGGTDCHECR